MNSGNLIALLVIPLTFGTCSWAPANMGCARETWFVKSEFNIFVPVLFRAVLRTSLRNSWIYTLIAAIVMVYSTMERVTYSQVVQLPTDPQKTFQDKQAVESYLRASLASFLAIMWIEGCTLYRLLKFYARCRGVWLPRPDILSIILLGLAFNSFLVLRTIAERVVTIFSSLNNDTSLYVYWLLAAASTVTRVFVQGVILSSSAMRAKKELSSILWLNNTVMLVQFALLAYGYLYDPHTVQLQLMKPTPTLLGCMVVADFLFRAGTVVWLFCNPWIGHRAIQGNGPAAIQGNGPAAIQGNGRAAIQGNGPAAIQGNGPVAIQGNGPEEAAGSTFRAPIEAVTSGMPSEIVLSTWLQWIEPP